MLKPLYDNNYRLLHIVILAASISALLIAYYVEYILEVPPCPLCIYQRFPYLSLIKISLTAIIFKQISKYGIFFAICTFLLALLISGYHIGIEHKIFSPSALCSTHLRFPKHLSVQAMKDILYSTNTPSCVESTVNLFRISMTEWNFLFNLSLLILVVSTFIAKNNTKNNDYSNIVDNKDNAKTLL